METLDAMKMTQTIIFVSNLDFVDKVRKVLKKNGYEVAVVCSRKSKEQRDEIMEKFRTGEVNVVLTTNFLARGIQIPRLGLVINFDIPKLGSRKDGGFKSDIINYIHRLGRLSSGPGATGIALTLYDNDEDE